MNLRAAMPFLRRIVATALACILPLLAGGAEPAGQTGISAEQADAMLQELRAIRALLEKQGSPPRGEPAPGGEPARARIPWSERPRLGRADAPVIVVEFTDYACPFCQRFHETTWPSLRRDFVDTGLVTWVVYDLPLPIHPEARGAAQAVRCAGDQGRYWELRPLLYANRESLARAAIEKYADSAGVNGSRFRRCLDGGTHMAAIDADAETAAATRITGTPTFLIGRLDGDFIEGGLIVGAQSAAVFDGAIRAALPAPAPEKGE